MFRQVVTNSMLERENLKTLLKTTTAKMLQNYQFCLKPICIQYFSIYCLICIFFTKCCLCSTYDNVDLNDFGDRKSVSIDSAEIIRRRSVVEAYLKERDNSKEDWIETYQQSISRGSDFTATKSKQDIETYHESFSRSSIATPTKAKQESSLGNGNEVHVTVSSQNVDSSSPKNLKDSASQHKSSFSGMDSAENLISKSRFEDLKKTDKITSEEFFRRYQSLVSFRIILPDVKKYEFDPETIYSKNSFEKLTKGKTIKSKMVTDRILKDSLKGDNDPKTTSHSSKETGPSIKIESKTLAFSKSNELKNFSANFEMVVKNVDESQLKLKPGSIYSAKLTHKGKSGNTFGYSNGVGSNMFTNFNSKDNKLDSNIKFSTAVKSYDLEMNEHKNLSVNTDEIIEVVVNSSKFISKKYFINGETLTLTEFYKLQEYLARLSFLQNSKNNIYSINRIKIIESIGKVISSQNEPNQENIKPSCQVLKTVNVIADKPFNDDINNVKQSKTDFDKRVGFKIGSKVKTSQNIITDLSVSDPTNYERGRTLSSNLESSDSEDVSYDPEILRRKKIMNSFITTLHKNKQNWIETYQLNVLKSESETNLFPSPIYDSSKKYENSYNLQKMTEGTEKFSKVYYQEKYIIRWINKLQNKLKNSGSGYRSLSILISTDLHKILGELSQEFDIVMFDQLVNSMISNATFDNYFSNILYFDFDNVFNTIYLKLNSSVVYILTIAFGFFLLCSLHSKNILKKSSILLCLVLLLSFAWQANKMYQQKIAEKHTVMSRVVPSYCESILIQESGVYAHFKEFFRSWWHDEDCKKYYEAVMVDPSAEISLLSISTDLISSAIFQLLGPFGRNLNLFYKELTHDLGTFQRIFIIFTASSFLIFILVCCLYFTAVYCNYKISFPFHLGSIEPTEFSVGSRVEEINEKKNFYLKGSSTIYNTSLVNLKNTAENKNRIEDIILQEKSFEIKSKCPKLKVAKYSVHKTRKILTRARSNSI